ncbi:MAG: hypothetical protein QOJ19_2729 [Acidimicrobiia bacterium]|jgi:uncharacterized protein YndB with AHSA1/START domain|nr:hypothetical protein [Acidimicrobiia bacterium]
MTTFTRRIHLDAPSEEVWPLLAQPEGWARWLTDDAEVDVRPGGGGRVVEDGVARGVEIEVVEPQTRVAFRWWREDDARDASHVELTLVPGDARTTVVVTETRVTEPVATIQASVAGSLTLRAEVVASTFAVSPEATVAPTAGLRLWLATTSLVRA